MVVGDIVNYSTISQVTDEQVMAQSLHTLWNQLGAVLHAHHGTLNHYAGDALFAVWEVARFPDATERAIDFALAANRLVDNLGPELPLRGPDGLPIHMGWGVVQGMAALAAMTRSVDAVIGDATNVAFRLSGLAGRQGRAAVLVTSGVHSAVAAQFTWGASESVEIKGRHGMETVFPVIARKTSGGPPPAEPTTPQDVANALALHQLHDLRQGFTGRDPANLAGAVDLVPLEKSDAARVGMDREIGLRQHLRRRHRAANRHGAHERVDEVRHPWRARRLRRGGGARRLTAADGHRDQRAVLTPQRGYRQVVEDPAIERRPGHPCSP